MSSLDILENKNSLSFLFNQCNFRSFIWNTLYFWRTLKFKNIKKISLPSVRFIFQNTYTFLLLKCKLTVNMHVFFDENNSTYSLSFYFPVLFKVRIVFLVYETSRVGLTNFSKKIFHYYFNNLMKSDNSSKLFIFIIEKFHNVLSY